MFESYLRDQGKRLPDGWNESPKCLQQKELDTLWFKKMDTNHYGYRNSIFLDAEHGFIRCFVVTPANIHDAYIKADSAYSGERFKDLLGLDGFLKRTH